MSVKIGGRTWGGILNGKESIKKAYEVLYVLQMQLFRFDS
nr:MAG TPA: hypothetical protein [Caudoviricetes sp.]